MSLKEEMRTKVLVETNLTFVKSHSKSDKKYKQDEIIQMFDFLIDNLFGGRVFQQTIDIPMGTNCASLLADLFTHDYEADFH